MHSRAMINMVPCIPTNLQIAVSNAAMVSCKLGQVAQYSDVIWASWGLKSTTDRLFVQPFDQADIKDNI